MMTFENILVITLVIANGLIWSWAVLRILT
jgi:hypothetical protein